MELLIIGGFTAFFCWYTQLVICLPSEMMQDFGVIQSCLMRSVGLLGFLLGLVLVLSKPSHFDKKAYSTSRIVIWGLLGFFFPVLCLVSYLGVAFPGVVQVLVYVISGFSAAYFYTGWENLAARGRIRDVMRMTGVVMSLGLALCVLLSALMNPIARNVMAMVMMLICAFLFSYVSKRRFKSQDDAQEEEKVTRPEKGTFSISLTLLLLCVNIPMGFALPLLWISASGPAFYVALCAAVVLMLVFTCLIKYVGKLTFSLLLRIGMSLVVLALVITAVTGEIWPASVCVLIPVWLLFRLAHMGTLLKLTHVQNIEPIYLVVRGKFPGYAGFGIGFVLGIAMIVLNLDAEIMRLVALALIAVLSVVTFVVMPVSESYSGQMNKSAEEIDAESLLPESTDRDRCALLAKRFGLSNREEEVLFYIVKGRNAKYIAEKLVISESTAKTHIHNIYKKSGVHSQQKFIDMLDELA